MRKNIQNLRENLNLINIKLNYKKKKHSNRKFCLLYRVIFSSNLRALLWVFQEAKVYFVENILVANEGIVQ